MVTNRQRQNQILMLKNDNGEWTDDQSILKTMGVEFYKNLFSDIDQCDTFSMKGAFPSLTNEERQNLVKDISDEEIKLSFFSMGGWKALWLDGLPTIFF